MDHVTSDTVVQLLVGRIWQLSTYNAVEVFRGLRLEVVVQDPQRMSVWPPPLLELDNVDSTLDFSEYLLLDDEMEQRLQLQPKHKAAEVEAVSRSLTG